MTTFRRLLDALRASFRIVWEADPSSLLLIVIAQVTIAAVTGAQLFALRSIIGRLESGADSASSLTGPIAVLIILVSVGALTGVAMRELRLVANEAVERVATLNALGTANDSSLGQFEDSEFHDLLRRATRNIGGRVWAAVWSSVAFVTGLLTIASLSLALVILAPVVFAVAIVSAVPALAVARKNSKTLYEFNYNYTSEDRRRQSLERTILDRRSAAELRSLEAGGTLLDRVEALFDDRLRRIRRIAAIRAKWSVTAAVVGAALAGVAIVVLVDQIATGQLDLADGLVAFVALQQLTTRARALAQLAGDLDEAGLYLADYTEFVGTEIQADEAAPHPAASGAVIGVRDLEFTYPGTDRQVLHRIDLEIRPGQFVALVGENGSGKSTLAKVLAGLYEPDADSILWGDTPISPKELRRSTSFMFQDFARFPLSLADNVSLGPDALSRNRFDDAIDKAHLDELAARLPAGADTILSREFLGGSELSGGEWQRVALARTMYRDTPFVILDEPSAAFDPRREAEFFESFRTLYQDRVVLYISHRFSAVRSADLIYVMGDGRIIESGTHDELIAAGHPYAELFDLQAAHHP